MDALDEWNVWEACDEVDDFAAAAGFFNGANSSRRQRGDSLWHSHSI